MRRAATIAAAFILCSFLPYKRQTTALEVKKEVMQGRVLADVGGMSDYLLLGDSPNGKIFIFGMESSPGHVTPIKVRYEFFKWQGRLSASFFDYHKRYELSVVRNRECDETIEHLSHMQAEDRSGNPQPPLYVLRPLVGAPRELLRPELLLPCYVLKPRHYRALKANR